PVPKYALKVHPQYADVPSFIPPEGVIDMVDPDPLNDNAVPVALMVCSAVNVFPVPRMPVPAVRVPVVPVPVMAPEKVTSPTNVAAPDPLSRVLLYVSTVHPGLPAVIPTLLFV